MRVYFCDICGDQIEMSNETDKYSVKEWEERRLKNYPNGYFVLEFQKMILGPDKKPSHFGYRDFHMCERCSARINKSIFEAIAKIRESTYRPTAIIEIGKFPPEPEVMPQTMCGCNMTEQRG